jgi:medium-chain acyl-[acyl-carrier-protein] hydrolase
MVSKYGSCDLLKLPDAVDVSSKWLLIFSVPPPVHFRLICFPPAGIGAAIFRNWASELPGDLELCAVQLPGRTIRLGEPAMTSIPQLVEAITEAIAQLPERKFVFFGHSLGAILASEVARRLTARALPLPSHLIVSGRRPPQFQDPNPPIGDLPDAEFVAAIDRRYGGIPKEILANPDVLALLLPGLRADMVALETFRPGPRPPLPIPISAFGGASDPMTPIVHLEAWKLETLGAFETRAFPGGHFYLDSQRNSVLSEIARIIAPILASVEAEI